LNSFKTTLVKGGKPPYSKWTFLVFPPELANEWGAGRKAVCGTIAGAPFRGTVSWGENMLRMPVSRELRQTAGVRCGDTVEVEIELDGDPRPVSLPDELRAVFDEHPGLGGLYGQLSASLQRAWASYVETAKRPETRVRRARKAVTGIKGQEYPS